MRESIRVRVVLAILFLFWASSKSIEYAHQTRLWDIPPATEPGTPDQVKWWEGVQAAGRDLALARARKDEAYGKAVKRYYAKHQNPMPDDERKIFQKEELDILDAAIATSRERYVAILRDGSEKGFKALIPDGNPHILFRVMPRFTESARQNRVQGIITARVEFLSDGTIGTVKVLRGVGSGLDKRASEAIRGLVFLPARKEGLFINHLETLQVEFKLR